MLLRVLEAAKSQDADVIVELTGDCPCIDWRHIDQLLEVYMRGSYDLLQITQRDLILMGLISGFFCESTGRTE